MRARAVGMSGFSRARGSRARRTLVPAGCARTAGAIVGRPSGRHGQPAASTHRQPNSRPQPRTCAGSAPAARSMPQTVVLTVSSSGMSSSASTALGQRRGAQVGAEGRDGLRAAPRPPRASAASSCSGSTSAKSWLTLMPRWRSATTSMPMRAVVVDDALLHVGGVGRDQRQPRHAAQREQFVQRQHRGGGRDAGALADALDQAPVGVEAQPARRRAAPADHVDLARRPAARRRPGSCCRRTDPAPAPTARSRSP